MMLIVHVGSIVYSGSKARDMVWGPVIPTLPETFKQCLHGHEQKSPTGDYLLVSEQSGYLTMLFSRFSPSFNFTGSISQDLWLWQIWKSIKMVLYKVGRQA